MRTFHLTSPLMRGSDVLHLQQAINRWRATERHQAPISTDGVYGPATDHAAQLAAWELGLNKITPISPGVTRRIEHPHLRDPAELVRARHRAKVASEHAAVAGRGLAAIPHLAAHYIGIAENPPGSNEGSPYPSRWEENFGMNGVSWCGCFAGSMVLAAGGHVTSRVAYCPSIEADARSKTNGFDLWVPNHDQGVGPGWLVLYCWDGSGVPEHVGVVESIHADHLVAIEGNTGGTNPSDGGMVAREQRSYSFTVGYARPRF